MDSSPADPIGDGAPARSGPEALDAEPGLDADLRFLAAVASEFNGVEAALARLDEGSYGACATCGSPLDPAALEADPLLAGCAAHG